MDDAELETEVEAVDVPELVTDDVAELVSVELGDVTSHPTSEPASKSASARFRASAVLLHLSCVSSNNPCEESQVMLPVNGSTPC